MATKTKARKFSVSVALRAVVSVPVTASSLEEAQNITLDLGEVASFTGNDVQDYRLDVVGVSEDTGWDFLSDK